MKGVPVVLVAIASSTFLSSAIWESQFAQKAKDQSAPKATAKYQVDFRLQIASQLDRQQVVIWTNLLKELGAAGVSQVPGEPAVPKGGEQEEPVIEPGGAGRVLVRASLGPSGNLFIGTEGYRLADRARLAGLIKSLQTEGVPVADPAAPMWGLSRSQVGLLQDELKQASKLELENASFDALLKLLRDRIKLEIKMSREAEDRVRGLKWTATTNELSLGTALAYVLGQSGLAWEPRQAPGGSVSLLILRLEDSQRPWPVGIVPEQSPGTIAPPLMATARYQTNNMLLEDVLAAFRRELKMEVLLDRAGLVLHDLDPDALRSTVQVPGGTFLAAIRKTLAPMGLKHELRIDEANRAFLWITWSEPTGSTPRKKP